MRRLGLIMITALLGAAVGCVAISRKHMRIALAYIRTGDKIVIGS